MKNKGIIIGAALALTSVAVGVYAYSYIKKNKENEYWENEIRAMQDMDEFYSPDQVSFDADGEIEEL